MEALKVIGEENQRQWEAIHTLTTEVKTLTGTVAAQNSINKDLVDLLRKALTLQFYVIVILIGALVYGAIGKDGLFAVRQALPGSKPDGTAYMQPLAPPPDNRSHGTAGPKT